MSTAASGAPGPSAAGLAATITGLLRDVPDFPKPGIVFKDISPLLADAAGFSAVVDGLAAVAPPGVDAVAGVEARGFLLAGAVAVRLGTGVVPVRKAGKLPPPTQRRSYELEYGTAEIEVPDAGLHGRRLLLIDDVLATGGTLHAAAELLQAAGAEVVAMAVIFELGFLPGRQRLADAAALIALATV